MRFSASIQRHLTWFLSGTGILAVLVLACTFLPFFGSEAQAAQATAQVTCLDDNGNPEPFAMGVGTNTGSGQPAGYAGGYPIFDCVGGQPLVIAPPGTPASAIHTVTASCPTAAVAFNPITETLGEGEFAIEMQYVSAVCNPPGEVLTLTVQDPPGINPTQHAGTFPYTNDPGSECPPDCGLPTPELPPECEEFADNPGGVSATQCIEEIEQYGERVPTQVRQVCEGAGQEPPFGLEDFDIQECIDQAMGAGGDMFSDAITRQCTLLLTDMPVETSEQLEAYQAAYAECEQGYLAAAGLDGDPAEPDESCETRGGPFSWILCLTIRAASSALSGLQEGLDNALNIDDEYYANDEFRRGWGIIRSLAYLVLVPVTLVMVIGTALGFDFISAYTVKRALPRLVIAVMGIALSYELCVFLIEFFNTLGTGAFGLVTAAFPDSRELTLASLLGEDALEAALASAAIVFAVVFAFVPLLIMVLTAFVVVAVRQMLIVGLILASPLALLGWIFPANQKLWGRWWGLFTHLLMMYPIMMAVIGLGRVFAHLVQVADEQALVPFVSWASSLAGIDMFAQLEDTPLIGDMIPAVILAASYPIAIVVGWAQGGAPVAAVAGFAGGLAGKMIAKPQGYLNDLKKIRKDDKYKKKVEKRERRLHERLEQATDPGIKGWRRVRNKVTQYKYAKDTGQLGPRRGFIGPHAGSPLIGLATEKLSKIPGLSRVKGVGSKGLARFRDKQQEFIEEGLHKAIEQDDSFAEGYDAMHFANREANNEKEWDDIFRKNYKGDEDVEQALLKAKATATRVGEIGSRKLQSWGRRNAVKSATSVSYTGRVARDEDGNMLDEHGNVTEDKDEAAALDPYSMDAQVQAFNEFYDGHGKSQDDSVQGVTAATNEVLENATSRREFSGGEYENPMGLIGKKAANGTLTAEDVEKHMDAVLGEGNILELSGGNYRSLYPIADAMRRRIQRGHADVHSDEPTERVLRVAQEKVDAGTVTDLDAGIAQARQEAQDKLDSDLATLKSFADQDGVSARDKKIIADGVHNVRINSGDREVLEAGHQDTIWNYGERRRGSTTYRQGHTEYGPGDDERGRPTPPGGGGGRIDPNVGGGAPTNNGQGTLF